MESKEKKEAEQPLVTRELMLVVSLVLLVLGLVRASKVEVLWFVDVPTVTLLAAAFFGALVSLGVPPSRK